MVVFFGVLLVIVVALVVIRGTIVMQSTGLQYCLELERATLNTCNYHLYTNNVPLTATTAPAAFTECTDGGYASWHPGFTATTVNGSGQGQVVGPAKTFTFALDKGAFTVYGYYVTDPTGTILLYAEAATVPFAVNTPGQTYTVTPQKLMGTM